MWECEVVVRVCDMLNWSLCDVLCGRVCVCVICCVGGVWESEVLYESVCV